MERERERIHARERDTLNYGLNDGDEFVSDRHYGGRSGAEYPMHRDDRRVIDPRDALDRDPRLDQTRERPHLGVGSNSRHLVNNSSNYDNDSVDLIREKDPRERLAHGRRGDMGRDDYSPHRGNSRRVLNNINAI